MRAAGTLIVVLRHLLRTFDGLRLGRALQPGEIGSLRFAHHLHAHHGQQSGKHGFMNAFGIPRTAQAMRRLLVQRQLSDLQTGA